VSRVIAADKPERFTMSDAVRITHYKVIWEAQKQGGIIVLQDDAGARHEIRVRNPAALAALMLTLRSEPDLIFEPSGERLFSGDWRPVGWIRED
jgi:hypothetical protein